MSDEHDWLGDLPGVKDIQDAAGITYPRRARLRFEGATVADDPVNGRTVVSVPGSGAPEPPSYLFLTSTDTVTLNDDLYAGRPPGGTLLIIRFIGPGEKKIVFGTMASSVGVMVLVYKSAANSSIVIEPTESLTWRGSSSPETIVPAISDEQSFLFSFIGNDGDFVLTPRINGAVGTALLADGAVTNDKMANIAAGTILGNVTGGSGAPAANAPNDYVFASDGFSLKVAPQHVAALSSIADSGDDSTSATLGSDGIYLFTVLATATGSGGSYLVAYKVRGQLSSGTLTLGTPVPIEADDTGDIDLSFADDSGALEVTVSNTSGATVNARVAVGWLFCPVPAAP